MSIINKGTLLSIEFGEYSDHSVIGFFVALADFDPAEMEKAIVKEWMETAETTANGSWLVSHQDFITASLIRRGLLLEVSYSTLHIEDYSKQPTYQFYPKDGQ